VYQVSNSATLRRARRRLVTSESGERVPRTVVLLGLTSLFTDISSEMVVAVLPLYLVAVGGFSPLAFGVIDGLYSGAAAMIGLAAGYVGDRRRRHKEVAATGYGLSALCKLLLATAGTAVSAIGAIILLDRAGKGIRTAPRDAMISLSTPQGQMGAAFGVHRALDTVGAITGPLVAFAILAAAPTGFTAIFVVSFCIALVGVAILVLFVRPPAAAGGAAAARPPSLRAALGMLRVRRFRALITAGAALSLATVSDAFVFLALQEKFDLGAAAFPLLFVGSAGTFVVLAVPLGRLADHVGRGHVLLGGYGLLLAVYGLVLVPAASWIVLTAGLALLGAYYAATSGVLMAFASEVVPDDLRGSGLALVGTVTNLARFAASIAFGALWTLTSVTTAIACFGGALIVAIALSALLLRRTREPVHV